MSRTRSPLLVGATTFLLLALAGGLASAAPGPVPQTPAGPTPASAVGPAADPLSESGRWEWAGGGTLNDIFFVDNVYGWAVGPGVWRTTDGGASWRRIGLLAGSSLQRVVFANRLRGWVRGEDGRIYRTDDGGETWTLKGYFPADRPTLAAVGVNDVWASHSTYVYLGSELLYNYDAVAHSPDGGDGWHEPEDPTFLYGQVADLDFLDPAKGWALGNNWGDGYCPAFVGRTANGGETWATSCIRNIYSAEGIAFGSSTHGWVISTRGMGDDPHIGVVWRSTDGGATWQEQATLAQPLGWIQAQDASRAWIGMGTTILRTTDGGTKWQALAGSGPTRAMFKTDSLGWGVAGGSIFKTTSGGASWQTVYTLPPGYAPWYWDTLTGWYASGTAIARTIDGGATWGTAATGLPAVDAFQFVDSRNGWTWHNESHKLAHTTDGGATWRSQNTGRDDWKGVQFVDAGHGWAWKNGSTQDSAPWLRRTTDGGLSWQELPSPPMPAGWWSEFWGVQFVSANRGWAVSGTIYVDYQGWRIGYLARTDDGGLTWGPVVETDLTSIRFLDRNLGFGWHYDRDVRSSECAWRIAQSSNGGGAWEILATGGACNEAPMNVLALDRERIWWLSWLNRAVRHSNDGGATWVDQRSDAAIYADGVGFDHTGQGYAQWAGIALRYRNTEVAAHRAARPPQIDGNLADWASVPAYVLNAERAYRVLWSTPTPLDASATLQAAWDAGNLYLAIRVFDDAVKVDSGAQPWLDDAIEVGLDGRHDHVRNYALNDDRQFTVTALGKIYESGVLLADVPVARATTSNGYILELAIPKAKLGELGLAAKSLAGLNWTLIDDDGGNADAKLEWTGTGASPANASWGQLRLSALEVTFNAAGTETATPTPTATSSATQTQTPTASATPTLIATATSTLTPTAAPTATPTPTPTATPTATPSSTPTASRTPTATASRTPTASATPLPRLYLPLVLR